MEQNEGYNVHPHPRLGDRPIVQSPLHGGGGGGIFDPMERIAKLEARADFAEQRLIRIEDKLDRVLEKLGGMPTNNGIWGMIATVIGVGIAIAGLTFMIAQHVAQAQ